MRLKQTVARNEFSTDHKSTERNPADVRASGKYTPPLPPPGGLAGLNYFWSVSITARTPQPPRKRLYDLGVGVCGRVCVRGCSVDAVWVWRESDAGVKVS